VPFDGVSPAAGIAQPRALQLVLVVDFVRRALEELAVAKTKKVSETTRISALGDSDHLLSYLWKMERIVPRLAHLGAMNFA
jgi:hypothetical protein